MILTDPFTPVDPDDYNLWDCYELWEAGIDSDYCVEYRYASNDSEITLLAQLEKILEES